MLLALLLLTGCIDFGRSDDTGDAECDRRPSLSWDNFGQSFVGRHCAGCHSSLLPESMRKDAPVGIDFDTYAGVLDHAVRIEVRSTGEAPDMPPGGGPGADEIALLEEWLTCTVIPQAEAR